MSEKRIGYLRGCDQDYTSQPDPGAPAIPPGGYFEAAATPGDLRGAIAGFTSLLLLRAKLLAGVAGDPNTPQSNVFNFLAGCHDFSPGAERGYAWGGFTPGMGDISFRFGTGAAAVTPFLNTASASFDECDYVCAAVYDPTSLNTEVQLFINGVRVSTAAAASYAQAGAPIQFSIGGASLNTGYETLLTQALSRGSEDNLIGAHAMVNRAMTPEEVYNQYRASHEANDLVEAVTGDFAFLHDVRRGLKTLADNDSRQWLATVGDATLDRIGTQTGASVEADFPTWQTSNPLF